MVTWLIAHSHELGLLASGWIFGVLFAAWRQVTLEQPRDHRPYLYDQERA